MIVGGGLVGSAMAAALSTPPPPHPSFFPPHLLFATQYNDSEAYIDFGLYDQLGYIHEFLSGDHSWQKDFGILNHFLRC